MTVEEVYIVHTDERNPLALVERILGIFMTEEEAVVYRHSVIADGLYRADNVYVDSFPIGDVADLPDI